MKKWVLKAVIQKVLSGLPAGHRLNFWFQKYVTKGVRLTDDHFRDKYDAAVQHLKFYHRHAGHSPYSALELGTGWYPVVPIALFLNGASRIDSYDISSLMNGTRIRQTIELYLRWRKEGRLQSLEPYIQEERWQSLETIAGKQNISLAELSKQIHLYLHLGDARKTQLPNNSRDLILSNNTFEHIYPEVLEGLIQEFQRVLKPGGVSSHFVDMSDHFAHLDSSISIYHFLRYTPQVWSRIDNSIQPQNRWRKPQYLDLLKEKGIEPLETEDRPGDPDLVRSSPLDSGFQRWSPEEIAVSHTHLVYTK